MRSRFKLCIVAAGLVLAGCNQPAVTLKPPAVQSSENTVRDWNDVAHKIANAMATNGLAPPAPGTQPATASAAPPPRPVFVRVQAPDSAFIQQVASELESEILARGGTIARTPTGATVVNLDVNFVQWGPRDKPPGLDGTMAAITTIPGIIIGASVPMSTWTWADVAGFSAAGYGVLSDLWLASYPTMNAEAVWQATIVTDQQVVLKVSEPVYIRSPDIPLYAKSASLTPVASWSSTPALATRRIRFDP